MKFPRVFPPPQVRIAGGTCRTVERCESNARHALAPAGVAPDLGGLRWIVAGIPEVFLHRFLVISIGEELKAGVDQGYMPVGGQHGQLSGLRMRRANAEVGECRC